MRSDSHTSSTGNQYGDAVRVAGMIVAATLTFAAAGCTRPSDQPVETEPECKPHDLLAGEWVGELSNASGSASRGLRASFQPAGQDTYLATYRTALGVGLPLRFDTTHQVTHSDGVVRIEDWREDDVPGLGDCRCRAVCTGSLLIIHYRSANGSGIIHLQRASTATPATNSIGNRLGDVTAEWKTGFRIANR